MIQSELFVRYSRRVLGDRSERVSFLRVSPPLESRHVRASSLLSVEERESSLGVVQGHRDNLVKIDEIYVTRGV